MFENLTERLGKTLKSIRGQARLTEDNIKGTLREVRMALLEADVALPVVKAFIEQVKERAVGTEVSKSLVLVRCSLRSYSKSWKRSWALPMRI